MPCSAAVSLSLDGSAQMVTRNAIKGCRAPYFMLVDSTGCFCVVREWTVQLSLPSPQPHCNNFVLFWVMYTIANETTACIKLKTSHSLAFSMINFIFFCMHTSAFWMWLRGNLRQPGKALHCDYDPARVGYSGRSWKIICPVWFPSFFGRGA